jgi:hypothetical protein
LLALKAQPCLVKSYLTRQLVAELLGRPKLAVPNRFAEAAEVGAEPRDVGALALKAVDLLGQAEPSLPRTLKSINRFSRSALPSVPRYFALSKLIGSASSADLLALASIVNPVAILR